jgi:hypothetical protein
MEFSEGIKGICVKLIQKIKNKLVLWIDNQNYVKQKAKNETNHPPLNESTNKPNTTCS